MGCGRERDTAARQDTGAAIAAIALNAAPAAAQPAAQMQKRTRVDTVFVWSNLLCCRALDRSPRSPTTISVCLIRQLGRRTPLGSPHPQVGRSCPAAFWPDAFHHRTQLSEILLCSAARDHYSAASTVGTHHPLTDLLRRRLRSHRRRRHSSQYGRPPLDRRHTRQWYQRCVHPRHKVQASPAAAPLDDCRWVLPLTAGSCRGQVADAGVARARCRCLPAPCCRRAHVATHLCPVPMQRRATSR